jgi:flagellar hook-associated protein 1 FlgK
VNDGKIYVRLTNQTTGETTRQDVDVLTTDTLSDVAARLDALTGIRASVVSGRLHIEAESDYKFDFLPGAISTPTTSNLTGTAAPSISGLYTGSIDQIYTCTVTGSGRIGVDSPLALEVKDQDGNLVKTINLGQGYVAGMKILINDATPEINAPLAISFNQSGKTLVDGESFTIEAIANSDTSGLLAAAGINAFFSGSNAANIAIVDEIVYDTSKVATAGGAEFTDNHTIRTMADLGQTQLTDLGNKRFGDYYRNISTQLGHTIDISDLNQKDSEGLLQNLANQQDLVSGVDINDEAAQLLVFERMFQASSKYMQTVKSSMDTLMQLIS